MSRRIVAVQHGDYRDSSRIYEAGATETYFGMTYTHDVLKDFFRDDPYMVICLNGPEYHERHGRGEWVSVTLPRFNFHMPGRVVEYLLARRINRLIRQFRPTHVLLRTGMPILSRCVLGLCRWRRYDTLVVLANVMATEDAEAIRRNRPLIRLLNRPFVFRVGNHKRPATQTLIENGLDPAKAVPWDWPGQRLAQDFPVKERPAQPFELVYAGQLGVLKGVGDLIDAAVILHQHHVDFRLTIIGSGDDQAHLEDKARPLPEGLVRFAGRVPNDQVFEAMRRAALVFVPSRHAFQEGMPLTLTEGLASRTPVIASDHPVLVRAFTDGEGLRFFRAGDPADLARVVQSVLDDPTAYHQLSATTAAAFNRVACTTTFGDLLTDWEQSPLKSRRRR